MKHYILSFIILLLSLNNLSAQRHEHKHEEYKRFKSEKIAYLTDQLELTPEEAQVFWPIYNEMEKKRMELFQEAGTYYKTYQENGETMNDQELVELSDKFVNIPVREANLQKEYFNRFREILTIKKVIKLHLAEKGFRRHLMQKYRKGYKSGRK